MRRTRRTLPLAACVVGTLVATAPGARAECRDHTSPCLDAEPLWVSSRALRFTTLADAAALPAGELQLGALLSFRARPAVLTLPAPSVGGRDVNVVRYALDGVLAAGLGLGRRLELTLLMPAALYQRGAGIKGVTDQAAPALTATSLRDPRLGFGYSIPTGARAVALKVRFEAKLPFGNGEALSGETGPVAAPSVVAELRQRSLFASVEIGARLRRPSDLYGLRMGSQAVVAAGVGYQLARAHLAFAVEAYALPSLIDSGALRYLPAEWLASARFAPKTWPTLSFGAGMGGGLPLSGDAAGSSLAFGVPSLRTLGFLRVTPGS